MGCHQKIKPAKLRTLSKQGSPAGFCNKYTSSHWKLLKKHLHNYNKQDYPTSIVCRIFMNFQLRLDGLISRMESFDVDFQVMGSQKLSIADIAFIWFLSIVNSAVSFELLWGEELCITIFTRKSVFSQMNSLNMLHHMSLILYHKLHTRNFFHNEHSYELATDLFV